MKQFILIAIINLAFASCSNKIIPLTNNFHTEPLHHKWQVTQMFGAAETPSGIYLDLRDVYTTHGSAGCDSVVFTPKYEKGNRVNFGNISVRSTMCKGTTLVDQQFIKNLHDVYYFSAGSNQLSLFNKSRQKLFEAIYHTDDEQGSLMRRWHITSMINGNNDQLIKDSAYIDLTNTGSGSAYVGCNQFNFPVVLAGDYDISFGDAATTRKFCKDALNEEVFSKILPLVKMYQVTGNKLMLFDKDNLLLLEAIAPLK